MDKKRAAEIVDSFGVIDVNYEGNPVWIENINSAGDTVQVKDLKTHKLMEVSVSELNEV